MMTQQDLKRLLQQADILEKAFDAMRLVDPVSNRVLGCSDYALSSNAAHCYDFWGQNHVCINCISQRAAQQDLSLVKLEYSHHTAFLVIAIPLEVNGRKVVAELLKELGDGTSFVFGDMSGILHFETSNIKELIDRLTDLSFKDVLTGLFNRRYIEEKLPLDLLNVVLAGSELTVAMADLDYFKRINDTYGHPVGDCVLQQTAAILSGFLQRDSDWVARYGGEEFLICLPNANAHYAARFAEQARAVVEAREMICEGKSVHITISFGVYVCRPTRGDTAEQLITRIDELLYQAKSKGRNRVELASGD